MSWRTYANVGETVFFTGWCNERPQLYDENLSLPNSSVHNLRKLERRTFGLHIFILHFYYYT